jgi:galactose-1-phosphate uridylyltransferase
MAADRKVRKTQTEAIYQEYLQEKQPGCPFCFKGTRPVKIVKEYQYWYVAENNFPYDAMFKISHLLTPYRHQESFWDLNQEELAELIEIRKDLVGGVYDIVLENLPHEKTQVHFHQHLLTWI